MNSVRLSACRFLIAFAFFCAAKDVSGSANITVDATRPGHALSPMLYGIFFEDINCSADGGLYAELVRNRNFEDAETPAYWSAYPEGAKEVFLAVDRSSPIAKGNPRALKITVGQHGSTRAGVSNEGFWGMGVQKGETYNLSLFARCEAGFRGRLIASLVSKDGHVLAEHQLPDLRSDWKFCSVKLVPGQTDSKARLVLSTEGQGVFYVDMVSLFPKNTWKKRPNGLRPDLAEMLADLKPSFVRFPGGCWVEGETMSLAYRWKQTIDNLSERRTQHNIWQYEATHGIGFHEYLQLCEDLKAEPLFVINCGMSHREVVPMDKMQEYVQDALDAIEYANGPKNSAWGAVRARNGHPAPFNLKYMEIGNENGGPNYHQRYALFYDAIKARYPQMHLVANEWGGTPTNRAVEIVDEHYYSTPEFFLQNAKKYDKYSRNARKVYVGEYAVTQGCGEGNLRAAVGEAAFMIGMERNSDVVWMASYAPLFANVNYKKWNPDLINFDSATAYGLPSYYLQKMFSQNRGDFVLPVQVACPQIETAELAGAIGVGTWRTGAEFKDLKVVQGDKILFQSDFADGTKGWKFHGGDWKIQDGALVQTKLNENIRAFIGDRSWRNYTYTLKARKTRGDEGFLIPFLVSDEEAKGWWNIGGWNNTRHGIEMQGVQTDSVSGSVETGRWYDVRIEVADRHIKCFLDGKIIHDVILPRMNSIYAGATRTTNGELILKVVNASELPQETAIELKNFRTSGSAIVTTLASKSPKDENSLIDPKKVFPTTSTIECPNPQVRISLPGNSVSVLRIAGKQAM